MVTLPMARDSWLFCPGQPESLLSGVRTRSMKMSQFSFRAMASAWLTPLIKSTFIFWRAFLFTRSSTGKRYWVHFFLGSVGGVSDHHLVPAVKAEVRPPAVQPLGVVHGGEVVHEKLRPLVLAVVVFVQAEDSGAAVELHHVFLVELDVPAEIVHQAVSGIHPGVPVHFRHGWYHARKMEEVGLFYEARRLLQRLWRIQNQIFAVIQIVAFDHKVSGLVGGVPVQVLHNAHLVARYLEIRHQQNI